MSHLSRLALAALRTLVVVGLFAIGLVPSTAGPVLASPSAAKSQTTSFQGLGEMPGAPSGAGFGTYASGISGDGSTIIGYGTLCTTFDAKGNCSYSDAVQADRWTVAGGYQLLGGPGSTDFFGEGAVSYDGSVVVGENPQPNAYAAFRWTAAQGMMSLPMNQAAAVTADGSMVAGGDNWWKTSGQTGNFGPFPGNLDETEAYGLSGTAQSPVAVGAAIKGYDFHAFRWTPSTGMQDLGLTTGNESVAIAISADASVIGGQARDASGFWRAFRWTAATGMVDIGTLGGPESAAYAANKDGSVLVGSALTSQSTGSDHAFRWTAKTGMQDLQKLLNLPNGWILQTALGVSADGTVIAGYGLNPKGQWEPFRAVVPLP